MYLEYIYQRVQSLQTFSPPVIILLWPYVVLYTYWESLCPKQCAEWPETYVEWQQMNKIHARDVSLQALVLHG